MADFLRKNQEKADQTLKRNVTTRAMTIAEKTIEKSDEVNGNEGSAMYSNWLNYLDVAQDERRSKIFGCWTKGKKEIQRRHEIKWKRATRNKKLEARRIRKMKERNEKKVQDEIVILSKKKE